MALVPVATDDYSTDTLATDYENGPGAYGNMAVAGGNILPAAANASCAAYHSDTVTDDQYSLITAAVQGDNDILGCIVRAQTGTGDGYEGVWRSNNDRWEIAVVDGGARTILAMQTTGYVDAAAGDQMRFEVEGQALRLYTIIDSVEVLQVETTDATHTGGLAGVAAAGVGAASDAQITALEIGNITADATEILAGIDTLTIAEQGAALSLDVELSGGTDSLTLSDLQAAVSLSKTVSAEVDVLTLTELAAGTSLDVGIVGAVQTLSLTEFTSQISTGKSIQAAAQAVGLTVFASDVSLDIAIAAGVDTLTVTELTAVVQLTQEGEIAAGVDSLEIVGLKATIQGVGESGKSFRITTGLMWV